ncbi:MAG: hypothetical protein LBT20_06900 [Clostridiales bacterium]|jgi:hypothetical protein|nr:hypothetical protein [Clostridiales bacterium]
MSITKNNKKLFLSFGIVALAFLAGGVFGGLSLPPNAVVGLTVGLFALLLLNTAFYSLFTESGRGFFVTAALNLVTAAAIRAIGIYTGAAAAFGTKAAALFASDAFFPFVCVIGLYFILNILKGLFKKDFSRENAAGLVKEAAVYVAAAAIFSGMFVWTVAGAALIFFYALYLNHKQGKISALILFVLTTALYIVYAVASHSAEPTAATLKLVFYALFFATLIAWFVHSVLTYVYSNKEDGSKKSGYRYVILSGFLFVAFWIYAFGAVFSPFAGADPSIYFFLNLDKDASPVILNLIAALLSIFKFIFVLNAIFTAVSAVKEREQESTEREVTAEKESAESEAAPEKEGIEREAHGGAKEREDDRSKYIPYTAEAPKTDGKVDELGISLTFEDVLKEKNIISADGTDPAALKSFVLRDYLALEPKVEEAQQPQLQQQQAQAPQQQIQQTRQQEQAKPQQQAQARPQQQTQPQTQPQQPQQAQAKPQQQAQPQQAQAKPQQAQQQAQAKPQQQVQPQQAQAKPQQAQPQQTQARPQQQSQIRPQQPQTMEKSLTARSRGDDGFIPISMPYDIRALNEKAAAALAAEDEESKRIDEILNRINNKG